MALEQRHEPNGSQWAQVAQGASGKHDDQESCARLSIGLDNRVNVIPKASSALEGLFAGCGALFMIYRRATALHLAEEDGVSKK